MAQRQPLARAVTLKAHEQHVVLLAHALLSNKAVCKLLELDRRDTYSKPKTPLKKEKKRQEKNRKEQVERTFVAAG